MLLRICTSCLKVLNNIILRQPLQILFDDAHRREVHAKHERYAEVVLKTADFAAQRHAVLLECGDCLLELPGEDFQLIPELQQQPFLVSRVVVLAHRDPALAQHDVQQLHRGVFDVIRRKHPDAAGLVVLVKSGKREVGEGVLGVLGL